ncbi:hypothetical protein BDK51DRAFT_10042, partial [Blyttiomyces helicus]
WTITASCLTFYSPSWLLRCFGMRDPLIQMAFREKIALCTIILFLTGAIGFTVFGFNKLIC